MLPNSNIRKGGLTVSSQFFPFPPNILQPPTARGQKGKTEEEEAPKFEKYGGEEEEKWRSALAHSNLCAHNTQQ